MHVTVVPVRGIRALVDIDTEVTSRNGIAAPACLALAVRFQSTAYLPVGLGVRGALETASVP